MELNKLIEKTKNFPDKIQNALKKDIITIVGLLIENYDIYERDSKVRITKEELQNSLFRYLQTEEILCSAIKKNGLRCLNKGHGGTRYCKIHYNKHMFDELQNRMNTQIDVDTEPILLFEDVSVAEEPKKTRMKLIDDTFYLVDDQFIYDKNSYEKVGYISKDGEYILTDDPFILGVSN